MKRKKAAPAPKLRKQVCFRIQWRIQGFPEGGGGVILQEKKNYMKLPPNPLDHPIVIIFSEDFQYKHITAEESKFHNKFICARVHNHGVDKQ